MGAPESYDELEERLGADLASARAEIESLKADNASLLVRLSESQISHGRLESDNASLRAALVKYGRHGECEKRKYFTPFMKDVACTCGFDTATEETP
jgi:hypothetical protein